MSGRKKKSGKDSSTSASRRTTKRAQDAAATAAKPPRVTVLAAAAVAQAAKEQQLTAEQEEQLKTRLQYRLYQRNHRAKKQRRTEELEKEVCAIQEELVELQRRRDQSRYRFVYQTVAAFAAAVSSSRLSTSSTAASSVYDTESPPNDQVDRLSGFVDCSGSTWTPLCRWMDLCEEFHKLTLEVEDVFDCVDANEDGEDVAIVSCGLRITMVGSADHFMRLLPALHAASFHHLAVKLAQHRQIVFPGRGIFVVSSCGRIHAVSMDFDFVKTLAGILEAPLVVVEGSLVGSRLNDFNLNTNQTKSEKPRELADDPRPESSQLARQTGQRLSMEFLLR